MLTAEEYKRAEFELTLADTRRGFKIHAVVYAAVITGLSVLNALLWIYTEGHFPWAVFPMVGWGIGLTLHYVDAFRRDGAGIRARQRKIEDYAGRVKELV